MIRMLGVISGAAIAIVLLTWLVGVPQFTTERSTVEFAAPVVDVAVPVVEVTEPAPIQPATVDEIAPLSGEPPEAEPVAVAESGADLSESILAGPSIDDDADLIALPGDDRPEPLLPIEQPADTQWFAFWSPFRSRIAADGFVSQLQRVTGLDYRVVRIKPGVYEVAFAYAESDEIDLNLSTISAATGLDLPGQP